MPAVRPVLLRLLVGSVLLSVGAAPLVTVQASTRPSPGQVVDGGDISWPNCPKGMGIPQRRTLGAPMPTSAARFVIVGLTNGPGFHANPCLASQVSWVRARHLWLGAYSVLSFPTSAQLSTYGGTGNDLTRLRRVGAAQAAFNLGSMRRAGLNAPMVWVDIEPVPGWPWSLSTARNNAVLDGALARYRAAGVRTGIYSYAYGWKQITGGRQFPGVPTWVPSGNDQRASAAARCRQRSFSGGPVWLGQWTAGGRDHNLTCPGVTGLAGRPHPLTPYLSTRLAQGSRGAAVAAVQRRVGATPDGVFGPRTRASVITYQRTHRLAAHGIVDRAVWLSLGAGSRVGARPSMMPAMFRST